MSTPVAERRKFMSEEIKEVTEVTTPEDGGKDELDSILDALSEDKSDEKSDSDSSSKDYFKKVGNHTFKSEEEYDTWAQKNYGEVSRLSGEMKKLQEKLTTSSVTPEARKETEQDIDALRMKIRAIDFFEDNADAVNYKEEMAAFIRAGKANDSNGRPSLKIAYEKALLADGKEVVKEREADIKKVMQAGGGDSGRLSGASYESKDDIGANDSFADSILTGRI